MEMKNVKKINICWQCGDYHDASVANYDFNAANKTVLCHCGGMVVTPSGKEKFKMLPIVPVWMMEEGGSIFVVAAETKDEAVSFLIDENGLADVSDLVAIEVLDSRSLNQKSIKRDGSSHDLLSIMDVLQQVDSFPALINSTSLSK